MNAEVKNFENYVKETAEKNSKVKSGDFRIRAKSIFLTYCVEKKWEQEYRLITKEYFMGELDKKFPDAQYSIIAKENYKDREDAFHFHCLLIFENVRLFRGKNFADVEISTEAPQVLQLPNGRGSVSACKKMVIHGNYMATRNLSRALTYCRKDGDFLEEGNLNISNDEPKEKKPKLSDTIADALRKGGTVQSVAMEYPGFFLQNQAKVVAFKHFLDNNDNEELVPWESVVTANLPIPIPSDAEIRIYDWLLLNVRKERELRQKQLWIKGPVGCGKTTFFMLLHKFLTVYTPIYECDYLEGYEPNLIDLCIFDEFKAQKTLTFLNSFIDGSIKKYNVKFSWITKRKNVPTIFLSNFTPAECYSKANDITLDAFIDRLEVVEVENLYGLCSWLKTIVGNNGSKEVTV